MPAAGAGTGTPSKIVPACGKTAALRQIMRQRQRKKDTANEKELLILNVQSVENTGTTGSSEETATASAPGISRTVSADEGNDRYSLDDADSPLPDEVLERSFSEESLSSSYWMLMEHGLDNYTDIPSMIVDKDTSRLDALESSFFSHSSSPEKTKASHALKSPLRAPNNAEPNVSWNHDTDSLSDRTKSDGRVVDSDEQISFSSDSMSPASDDTTIDAAKSAPSGSPFTTFRQNSTNIALDETKAYARRIQALEEELAHARRQAAQEAEFRQTLLRRSIAKTPVRRFSTPGNATPAFSNSSCPTTSSRQSRASAAMSVSHETLWERNKTLVTEIRFADQTCVELAERKAALEQHVVQLQSDNMELKAANQSLQVQVYRTHGIHVRAETELHSATESTTSQRQIELESDLNACRQRVCDRETELELRRVEIARLSMQLRNADDATLANDNATSQILRHNEALEQEVEDSRLLVLSLRQALAESVETSQKTKCQLEAKIQSLELMQSVNDGEHDGPNVYNENTGAQQESDGMEEQVERFQSEIDGMVLRMTDERAAVGDSIGTVMQELEVRSNELADAMVDKVRHLERRLLSCGEVVRSVEAMLQCKREVHEKSLLSIDEETSRECELDVTFSRNNDAGSADLSMMEEARINEIRQANAVKQCMVPSSIFDSEKSSTSSPSDDVLKDDASTLSESSSCSESRQSTSNQFQQHLSWLVSPNSMCAPFDKVDRDDSLNKRDVSETNPRRDELQLVDAVAQVEFHPDDFVDRRHLGFEKMEMDMQNQLSMQRTSEIDESSMGKQSRRHLDQEYSKGSGSHHRKEQTESLYNNITDTNVPQLRPTNGDTLRVQFLALQRSKNQAEIMLSQKSIFPRNRDRISDVTKDVGLRNKEVNKAVARNRNLTNGTLEESHAIYARRIENLESSIENIIQERDMLTDDIRTLTSKSDAATTERDRLYELSRKHVDVIENFEVKIRALTGRLGSSESLVEDLRISLKEENLRHADLNDTNRVLKATMATLEHDLNTVKSFVSSVEAQHAQTIQELKTRCLEADESRDTTIADKDRLLRTVTNLTEELHCTNDTLKRTKVKLIDTEVALRNVELSELESTKIGAQYLADLKATIVELNRSNAEVLAGNETVKSTEALVDRQRTEAKEMASNLTICRERVLSLESRLSKSAEMLQESRVEVDNLRSQYDSTTTKCTRLREYIRKLTKKCDEWEAFHASEASSTEQLKSAYDAALAQVAHFASTCETRESMCALEKNKVDCLQLANKRLETELSVIVRELSTLTRTSNVQHSQLTKDVLHNYS